MASLVLGVFAFSQAVHVGTNFGLFAGLICGVIVFLFVLFVVNKNSVTLEQIFLLTSPCWPAAKYPQAYWSSMGVIVFLSAFLNLMFHLGNLSAESLYLGLSLLGLGMSAGAIVAHYQVRRRTL
jgi:hypothetical protein